MQFKYQYMFINEGLEGRSCTGIACHNEDLVLVNWRTKNITIIDTEGETKLKFTHESLAEPTCLAVDPHYGHILVADNRKKLIFVFDEEGKLLFEVMLLLILMIISYY